MAVHAFGLGFVAFFIFGLGEHLLPRFTGRPIRAGALAWVQQALGHAGAIGLAAGFAAAERLLALAAGAFAWTALAVFALRIAPLVLGSEPYRRRPGVTKAEPVANASLQVIERTNRASSSASGESDAVGSPTAARTVCATRSGVKPKCWKSSAAGADSP